MELEILKIHIKNNLANGFIWPSKSPAGILIFFDWKPNGTFFSRKMILAETRYKTYNDELLAIIEAFKTWYHYLKSYNHKVIIFTDYNNFYHFMNMKSLSFWQVRWAQELFWYHFQINYCQGKVNAAANALSKISVEESKWKRWAPSWELPNLSLFTEFTNQS